jgi:hypothetical protein
MPVIKQYVVNVTKVKQPLIEKNMSYKIYNHTIQTNETVKSTIKKFRKNDSKPRKPQNTLHAKKRS